MQPPRPNIHQITGVCQRRTKLKHLIPYKDTLAGKGSQLAAAIEESPAAAKKVYENTTARFDAMYAGAAADRAWFRNWRAQVATPAPQVGQ